VAPAFMRATESSFVAVVFVMDAKAVVVFGS
jgi:hypothetical protein